VFIQYHCFGPEPCSAEHSHASPSASDSCRTPHSPLDFCTKTLSANASGVASARHSRVRSHYLPIAHPSSPIPHSRYLQPDGPCYQGISRVSRNPLWPCYLRAAHQRFFLAPTVFNPLSCLLGRRQPCLCLLARCTTTLAPEVPANNPYRSTTRQWRVPRPVIEDARAA
jgi:hypothetical protein